MEEKLGNMRSFHYDRGPINLLEKKRYPNQFMRAGGVLTVDQLAQPEKRNMDSSEE